MSVVDEVRERTDLVALIAQYVPLTKSGSTYKARCPFHPERTPSFVVTPDRGIWHCFGACGTGGDVFSFVMRAENIDFKEALRRLAERAGVALPSAPAQAEKEQAHARLHAALAAAATFYNNLLVTAAAAAAARAHLADRGIERSTWETYQLGYSPNAWDGLTKYLRGQGFRDAELVESGLAAERESGGLYDRFRNRLMIPIRDARGRTIGFGARRLTGEGPKYINSPATPLFDKSAVLFGLDRAQKAIRAADRAVIVEGYFDVLTAHQYGIYDVIGSMGTALTPRQIGAIKRLTKNLVLALDPDAAGDEATLRGIEVARGAFDRATLPVPTWRGLVQYQSTLDADIRILEMPRGVDPDELIRRDADDWRARVAAAKPVTDFLFDAVTARLDLATGEGKSRAVEQLLPVVQEIADPIRRAHYLQRLARLARVDERTLAAALARVRRRPAAGARPLGSGSPFGAAGEASEPGVTPGGRPALRHTLERYIVALVLRHPHLRARVGELEPEQFEDAAAREILRKLAVMGAKSLDSDEIDNLNFGATTKVPEMDNETAARAFADAQRRLREQRLRRSLQSLGAMQAEAQETGQDPVVFELAEKTVQFSKALGRLHRAQARPGAPVGRTAGRSRRP